MIKVWGRPTSTNTQRVLWALTDSGLVYELILASATLGPDGHVSKGGKAFGVVDTPAYRAMNPNGTIPTMDDDGFVLWESNAILLWLALKRAPEMLSSGEPRALSRALQWMSWTNERLEPPLHTLVMHRVRLPEAHRAPAKAGEATLALARPLALLDDHLAREPYLAGERFTIGDIPAAISVTRARLLAVPTESFPNVERWLTTLAERPGYRAHVAPAAHHLSG